MINNDILMMIDQHQELRILSSRMIAIISYPRTDVNTQELYRLRFEISSFLRGHLVLEEKYVYEPLRRSGAHQELMRTQDLNLQALNERYTDHIRKWTPAKIGSDWRGYGRDVVLLLGSLEDRLFLEESKIFPLMLPEKINGFELSRAKNWEAPAGLAAGSLARTSPYR